MNIVNTPTFKKYFVPGIVFQSVVIAGGYGTGRELIEFFLNYGVLGGFIAMCTVSLLTWSIICAVSFEFARIFKAYDYRTFFMKLLGKFWFLYEICYFGILLIVLAVIAATAGSILQELFGLNYWIGVMGMMIGVGLLVFNGNEAIEKFLSYWSFLLYAVYIIFLIFSFTKFGSSIKETLFNGEVESGFIIGGFKYAWYNLGVIPVILFTVRHIETRREAIGSGLMAGVIGIVPGIFLYLAMLGQYPDVLNVTVPTNYLLGILGLPLLQMTFQIVLFGTLIETGTGLIYAVNERVSSVYIEKGKEMPNWITTILTIVLLIIGVIVAQFGLIGLIAKGYGSMTWGFFLFFVVPVLTIGIWKIVKQSKENINI
ncbi:YkvI family membrane protein [Wukongibacter sp. M2B1]|uniref:YkvI family membrane protein n=1 Tax=Wukongibacter sp. M2B1 TaxID=3088895 RepID=UPI003D7A63FC